MEGSDSQMETDDSETKTKMTESSGEIVNTDVKLLQAEGGAFSVAADVEQPPPAKDVHKFESSTPFDIPVSRKDKESQGIMGRGKVSLILSKVKPGPHATAKAGFDNRILWAECVVNNQKHSSDPPDLSYYRFERKFSEEAVIKNVTVKVKKGHLKIKFDKITDFSLESLWIQKMSK